MLERYKSRVSLNLKMVTFHKLIEGTEKDLEQGKGFTLSDLRDKCNISLDSDSIPFSNREIKLLLCQHYGEKVSISSASKANKPSFVFFTKNSKEDMADLIQSINPIKECARAWLVWPVWRVWPEQLKICN